MDGRGKGKWDARTHVLLASEQALEKDRLVAPSLFKPQPKHQSWCQFDAVKRHMHCTRGRRRCPCSGWTTLTEIALPKGGNVRSVLGWIGDSGGVRCVGRVGHMRNAPRAQIR